MYKMETEGYWEGRDFNRRKTFVYFQLFYAAEANNYILVISDLPENEGMSVANCVELVAAELTDHLRLADKSLVILEQMIEVGMGKNDVAEVVFDEVTFGAQRKGSDFTPPPNSPIQSSKTVYSNPHWRRKVFTEAEVQTFLEPNRGDFFRQSV